MEIQYNIRLLSLNLSLIDTGTMKWSHWIKYPEFIHSSHCSLCTRCLAVHEAKSTAMSSMDTYITCEQQLEKKKNIII